MNERQAARLTILGGAALAVGSFLPWVQSGGETASGISGGDGWVTLVAGVVLAATPYLASQARPVPWWVIPAALATGIGIIAGEYGTARNRELSVGIGMWIMLAGSVLGLVGLLMGRKKA